MGVDALERTAVKPDSDGLTGVRLHTRMPVTPAWLARYVVPVARALNEAGAPAVQLRRGWLHGPHVDILARDATGVPGGGPDWEGVARALDAGPLDPPRALTEETYLDQAREFGRLEAVQPPYLPLREHGAVERIGPGVQDGGQTGGPSGAAARDPRLDRFRTVVHGALTPALLRTIDDLAGEPGSGTLRLAEAFVALADTHTLGLGYGVFSPRSHVEAFLAWAAPTKDVRPVFQQRLAKDAPALRRVVEQRLSGEVSAAAAAWRTGLAYGAGALESAVAAGSLTLDLLDGATAGLDRSEMGPPGATTVVPQGEQPDSDFHRTVGEAGVTSAPSPWFASFRLLTNLFYEQLPLLTVSPMQRYYTCFAVAETVDEVLGVSWRERIAANTTAGNTSSAAPAPSAAPGTAPEGALR
ncbi:MULTISPECIES: hypothetical protein [unclassified Streptomyces]|uniref:hypothetical protein n=1 Tax=unclassified Streptomyces TaxID=2593676 RepID=UPI001E63BB23|nr:hypothetical protein [Streptomyces sp. CB02980]MCB8903838.1 hypothetical protein [Streptomyces sp. CB02980]